MWLPFIQTFSVGTISLYSEAWVYGRSLDGIAGSNPAKVWDVGLL